MSAPYTGEIIAVGFNFAPSNWAECDGAILPIDQNDTLFLLIGTTYGGDGVTTFALPDLRGRGPMHMGQGPGLSNRVIGEQGGSEAVTLTASSMPSHSHTAAAATSFSSGSPTGDTPAPGSNYGTTPDGTLMHGSMVQPAGSGQPHENMSPFLSINWCICLFGLFPSR
jgi:microcystin-dependent protein